MTKATLVLLAIAVSCAICNIAMAMKSASDSGTGVNIPKHSKKDSKDTKDPQGSHDSNKGPSSYKDKLMQKSPPQGGAAKPSKPSKLLQPIVPKTSRHPQDRVEDEDRSQDYDEEDDLFRFEQ